MDYHRSDIAGAENYFTRVLSNAEKLVGSRSLSEYFVIRYQSATSVQSPSQVKVRKFDLLARCLLLRIPQEKLENRMVRGKEKRPSSLDFG